MIDEASIKTDREIWAVADDPSTGTTDGSKDRPSRLGGNLSTFLAGLGPSVRLHLGPGEYRTNGNVLPKTFILDAPEGGVTIKLWDNATTAHGFPHVRMFEDNQWSNFVCISGITFDGNWEGQGAALFNGNFKIEPLCFQSVQAKIQNCTVRNYGCNASDYGPENKLECFPLTLKTFANGDREFLDPRYANIIEPTTRLEILDNLVEQPHFVSGGYSSGINLQTNLGMDAGDRQPIGTRTTEAALVRGNRVYVPGGICYGCAFTESAVFEDNDGIGKCGWNLDTFEGRNITVRNNHFLGVNQGINVAPSGNGRNIRVEGNVILLDGPFWNAVLGKSEDSWGIRGRFLSSSAAHRNLIFHPAVWPGIAIDGMTGAGNVVRSLASAGVSQDEYDRLNTAFGELVEKLVIKDATSVRMREQVSEAAKILTEVLA